MSEEEIIKKAEYIIKNGKAYQGSITEYFVELYYLFNKEKEKNLLFKGATIIANLENDGIEINMNANKLVELYLEEKQRNEQLLNSKVGIDLSYDDYISKDKIEAKIEEYDKLQKEMTFKNHNADNINDCYKYGDKAQKAMYQKEVLQSLLEEDK